MTVLSEGAVVGRPAAAAPPIEPPDSQAAEIADALISLVRAHGSMKARLAHVVDPDLAPLFVLVRLVKDGPQRAKDVADQMCADQSTVSRQVAVLVKAGLIERLADPEDGRASILVPTESGAARVRESLVHRGRAIEPILAGWSAGDRSMFLELLRRYTGDLEVHRDEVIAAMGSSMLHSPVDSAVSGSNPQVRMERFV